MTHDDDNIDWNTVPPAKMLHMVMQEIVDTRNELKQEFKQDIAVLEKKIDEVAADLSMFRHEVHQNQTAFMTNLEDHDRRITVLEMAA